MAGADDRIAEIQRDYDENRHNEKAIWSDVGFLLAEIECLRANLKDDANYFRRKVDGLREQVAQLEPRHAAAIKALDEWIAEGNVVAWAMAARSILDGTADDSARVRAALSPVTETEES